MAKRIHQAGRDKPPVAACPACGHPNILSGKIKVQCAKCGEAFSVSATEGEATSEDRRK